MLVSLVGALAALGGLAGCYDLSAPPGPTREDFIHNRASSAGPAKSAAPPASCPDAVCPATPTSALRALDPAPRQRDVGDEIEASGASMPSSGSITVD